MAILSSNDNEKKSNTMGPPIVYNKGLKWSLKMTQKFLVIYINKNKNLTPLIF